MFIVTENSLNLSYSVHNYLSLSYSVYNYSVYNSLPVSPTVCTVCAYLAVGHYLQGEGGEVQGVHNKAQLVPRLFQKVLQPFVPQTLHV